MALQYSVGVRNAQLDAVESTISTAPLFTLRTGAPPADCATANSGTVLASFTMPSDWMAGASSGSKAKSGTWQDTSADNSGTIGHFRVRDSGDVACHIQGTAGTSADLVTDSASITAGQSFTVNTFTLNAGNA